MAEKNNTFDTFKAVLQKNGAEFSDSFIENLLRLIKHMQPKPKIKTTKSEKDNLAEKFPALSMPNDIKIQSYFDYEKPKKHKKLKEKEQNTETFKKNYVVDELMATLEALAPSQMAKNEEILKKEVICESNHVSKNENDRNSVENLKIQEDPLKHKAINKKRSRSSSCDRRKRKETKSRHKDRSRRNSNSRSRSKTRQNYKSGSKNRNRQYHRSRSRSRTRQHYRSRSQSKTDRDSRSSSRSRETRSSRPRSQYKSYLQEKSKRLKKRRERTKSLEQDLPCDPEVGKIYNGKVANIVPFGCFVQLENLKKRWEGLVHISQLRQEGRVTTVSDVVSRGQKVKVRMIKFLSFNVLELFSFQIYLHNLFTMFSIVCSLTKQKFGFIWLFLIDILVFSETRLENYVCTVYYFIHFQLSSIPEGYSQRLPVLTYLCSLISEPLVSI